MSRLEPLTTRAVHASGERSGVNANRGVDGGVSSTAGSEKVFGSSARPQIAPTRPLATGGEAERCSSRFLHARRPVQSQLVLLTSAETLAGLDSILDRGPHCSRRFCHAPALATRQYAEQTERSVASQGPRGRSSVRRNCSLARTDSGRSDSSSTDTSTSASTDFSTSSSSQPTPGPSTSRPESPSSPKRPSSGQANGRHEPEASTSSSADTAFPSSSTFTFDVESLLSDAEKALKRKDAGNVAFKAKRYGEALDLYLVRVS